MHSGAPDSLATEAPGSQVVKRESVHLSDLEALVLLAEHRSLREIGRIHGRTPSAVGKALRRAEASLGVTLTERREGSVRLTEVGLRLAPRVRRILASWEALKTPG